MTFDYVLYKMSWVNVIMYNSVLPSYDLDDDGNDNKGKRKEGVISADDPANREKVLKILFEKNE